jgi:hypothetical protein
LATQTGNTPRWIVALVGGAEMSALLQVSPIDAGFRRIKVLVRQGRIKVRTLCLTGHQAAAEQLTDRLNSVENMRMEHFDDLPMSQAVTLLDEVAMRVQEAIDTADAPSIASVPSHLAVSVSPETSEAETEDGRCSIKEAARITNLKVSTVWSWTKEGKISTEPHPTDKRIKLVRVADVRAYQQRKQIRAVSKVATPKTPKIPPKSKQSPTPQVVITAAPVAPIAPASVASATDTHEKPQRFMDIFAEADWWHDAKPYTPPPMVNVWEGVAI